MLVQTNADKSFVSIIESEIEDLQNEKSSIIQDQNYFVTSLYKGKSEVDDQIALQDKLEEFDFVAESEEEDGEDLEKNEKNEHPHENMLKLVSLILLDHDLGLEEKLEKGAKYARRFLERNFLKQDGEDSDESSESSESEAEETIEDYEEANR